MIYFDFLLFNTEPKLPTFRPQNNNNIINTDFCSAVSQAGCCWLDPSSVDVRRLPSEECCPVEVRLSGTLLTVKDERSAGYCLFKPDWKPHRAIVYGTKPVLTTAATYVTRNRNSNWRQLCACTPCLCPKQNAHTHTPKKQRGGKKRTN